MDQQTVGIAKAVALGGLAVLGAVIAIALVIELREVLAVVFLGVIISITLAPMVDALNTRAHIPKIVSILGVYMLLAAALSAFLWYAIPELMEQLTDVTGRLSELEAEYNQLAEDTPLPQDEAASLLRDRLGAMFGVLLMQAPIVLGVVLYIFTIFVVGILYTLVKEQTKELALLALPTEHRERGAEFFDLLGRKLRRYALAQFLTMAIVGLATYFGLVLLGINSPLLLATLAFVLELVPIVGPVIAYLPALALALTDGWVAAVQVTVLYVIIQQLESNVLMPLLHARETSVPALLILVSILVGGTLMGIFGALIAVPVGVIVHAFVTDVLAPWRRGRTSA